MKSLQPGCLRFNFLELGFFTLQPDLVEQEADFPGGPQAGNEFTVWRFFREGVFVDEFARIPVDFALKDDSVVALALVAAEKRQLGAVEEVI